MAMQCMYCTNYTVLYFTVLYRLQVLAIFAMFGLLLLVASPLLLALAPVILCCKCG